MSYKHKLNTLLCAELLELKIEIGHHYVSRSIVTIDDSSVLRLIAKQEVNLKCLNCSVQTMTGHSLSRVN